MTKKSAIIGAYKNIFKNLGLKAETIGIVHFLWRRKADNRMFGQKVS